MPETWKPIEDLPEAWGQLAGAELPALLKVWLAKRAELEQTAAVQRFNQQLHREWSIETGVIEGLYSLDQATTRLLIEQGIHSTSIPASATNRAPEIVAAVIRDHLDVLEGLFDFVGQGRSLSTSYVKELHAALTQHQPTCTVMNPHGQFAEVPLLRGDWKQLPNNPTRPDGSTHAYCPPEHAAAEIDRLIRLHLQHASIGVPPDLEAAWLHHRFVEIHPFMDGNGRVARCLATLVLVRANLFPVVVTRQMRSSYIDALEAADRGRLAALVELLVESQLAALRHVLSTGTPCDL
jgi:Fic family protein